jgi:hypothetical protein
MTEEEAKTKWCPFARVAVYCGSPSIGSCNRYRNGPINDPKCFGSDCAVWIYEQKDYGHCGMIKNT